MDRIDFINTTRSEKLPIYAQQREELRRRDGMTHQEASRQALGNLTRRELEVVKLLTGGLSNKEIANRLNLAENTIKMHLQNAFRKMGARSRADAVRIALSKNINDLS